MWNYEKLLDQSSPIQAYIPEEWDGWRKEAQLLNCALETLEAHREEQSDPRLYAMWDLTHQAVKDSLQAGREAAAKARLASVYHLVCAFRRWDKSNDNCTGWEFSLTFGDDDCVDVLVTEEGDQRTIENRCSLHNARIVYAMILDIPTSLWDSADNPF